MVIFANIYTLLNKYGSLKSSLYETPEDHGMLEPQEPPTMNMSWKRNPTRVREIIQETEKYGTPEGPRRVSKKSKPLSSYVALMCDLVDQEPTSYEEAIQKK